MEKEYLYLGFYFDTNNNFILKIGTTNELDRRRKEHTRNYHKTKEHTMPKESEFRFIWKLPLSKYNTHRYEDKNIAKWKNENFGEYVRNDRFVCASVPNEVVVSIRKDYHINVKKLVENCPII